VAEAIAATDDPSGVAEPPVALPDRRAVAAWSLVHLALFLFSINVVSLYFPLWVVERLGAADGAYGLANSAAMAIALLLVPVLGTLFDQAPRKVPLLVGATLACAVFTALLGFGGLGLALACYVVAVVAHQAAGVFADALLPLVSDEANRGRVGGVGVAVGYLGAIVGVGAGLLVLAGDPARKPLLFVVTALLVTLFTLPVLRWVPETPRPGARWRDRANWAGAWPALRGSLERTRAAPGFRRFLVVRGLAAGAGSTLGTFLAIYANRELGFGDTAVQLMLLSGIVAGILAGLAVGAAADRIGPKRALATMLAFQTVVFAAGAAIPLFGLPRNLLWLIAPLAGAALAGAWAADRPLLLRLAPPQYVGQFVGLTIMVGRLAAVAGPLVWTAVVDGLGWGRPAAILILAAATALAAVVLAPLADDRRRG